MKLLKKMLVGREGASAQEVVLIAGAVVLATVVAIVAVQSKTRETNSVNTSFNKLDAAIGQL